MIKKWFSLTAMVVLVSGVAGCASSGRNYQSDLDSLNSRVSSLQGQVASKDEELARLQSQVNDQQAALARSEADKQALSSKLDNAISSAESAKKAAAKPAEDAYLK